MTSHVSTRRAATPGQELLGSALSALMAVQFAVVVIFGDRIQDGGRPFPVLAARFGGQTVLLVAALLVLRRSLRPARGEWLPLVLAGFLGYATESGLYFNALNHGKAGAVTLLFYTYPVWVTLATIALDRRAPAAKLFVALALALAGSAVVVVGGGDVEVEPLGIVLALGTSVVYSVYLVTADRRVTRTDPVVAATWLGGAAAAGHLVFWTLFGGTVPRADDAVAVAGMAVFSAGAFAAMLGGLQLVGAVRNAIIGVLEPLSVAVLAAVFLSEPLTPTTAVGGVAILAGAVLATLVRSTTGRTPPAEAPVV
ncbi:MAG TPA: DMT family transporter [Actinomycetota bacterium]|nr:DMT family transporter [Actinomycetota bacterium]